MAKGKSAPVETLMLPELVWRKAHPLGSIEHVVRAAGEHEVEKRETLRVSPKIEEPVLVLTGGERIVVTRRKQCPIPQGVDGVLWDSPRGEKAWLSHKLLDQAPKPSAWTRAAREVRESWAEGIRYASERESVDGDQIPGLRPPQIGALHGVGAHWSLHRTPATVVMPTGTGKTETMIAALVGEMAGTLLVVVPSKTLRAQTTAKFRTLGLLRALGVISDAVKNPIVGTLEKRPRTASDLNIFKQCHVVVATMAGVSQGTAIPLIPKIAAAIDTLVVDEAHHIAARSWTAFRESFRECRVLQFTATPFRRDGKLVDGEVIYSYPLRRAQEDGYFKQITFDSVVELDPEEGDRAVATRAIEQLNADLDSGLDHLAMARCETIDRATQVHAIYQDLAPEHAPILVHSKEPDSSARVAALFERRSRIVVCVDMLGEGFDLPQLKVAAIHDTHKSLAVLLQFAGRFTRTSGADIGDATVVANIADQEVSAALERLYSEDADWNYLLAELSSHAIREHKDLVDFLNESVAMHEAGDEDSMISISPSLLRPMFSAAAFRTSSFYPKRFHQAIAKQSEVHRVWLHNETNTLYFVTRTEPSVVWTGSKQVRDRKWDLFVLHFNKELGILFLHSSDKSSLHEKLARAVTDAEPRLIRGDPVFRTLAGISRLQFQNIGITKHGRRNLRYAMYTGADVKQALEASQTSNATKSNLQGSGFERGAPINVGCSYKGRVWSKGSGPIRKFIDWCAGVGVKLVDEDINTDDIIENVMIPEEVEAFPDSTVLSIEWPIELLKKQEERVVFKSSTAEAMLSLVELVFDEVKGDRKSLLFHLEGAGLNASYRFQLGLPEGFRVSHVSGDALSISFGHTEKRVEELFDEWPPLVRFVDLSELDANLLLRPQSAPDLVYPAERFETWDWSGTDVTKESLWKDGVERTDSIQNRTAQEFIDGGFDIVFDDDSAGEAADLVCIKAEDDYVRMALVHCKFSKNVGGARVKDVVEVCSQAVRSGRWMWNFKGLCKHLTTRERRLLKVGRSTRFLHGSGVELGKFVQKARFQEVRGEIVIVQPGLSETKHTADQVAVLAAAHCFLNDTVGVNLDVICSG